MTTRSAFAAAPTRRLERWALAGLLAAGLGCRPADPPARAVVDASVVADAGPRCDPAPVCAPVEAETGELEGNTQYRRLFALSRAPASEVDLAEVSALMAQAADERVDVPTVVGRVDAMAAEVRRALPRVCDARCRLRTLVRFMFRVWHFEAEDDPNGLYTDPDRDLIDSVMESKRGYCEGLSVLFLALGRRLDLPLAGVLARQHIFVRYLGPGGPIDLDMTLRGDPPIVDPPLRGCSPRPGVYGVNLNAQQMVGPVMSVVGILDGIHPRESWMDAAVAMSPLDPDLRNNRGVEREARFDYVGALEDYRAAVTLDPCVSFYRANVASTLRRLGRMEEAEAALSALEHDREVGAVDDDPIYTSLARGDFLLEQGEDQLAQRWYVRALEASGGAPMVHEALGAQQLLMGDGRGAAVSYLASMEHDATASGRFGLVEALVLAQDYDNARVELFRAEREGGAVGEIAGWQAVLAARAGRWDEAEARARACIAADGGRCVRGLEVLGEVAAARGDRGCAAAYWRAVETCPHVPRDRAWQRRVAAAHRAIEGLMATDAGVRDR